MRHLSKFCLYTVLILCSFHSIISFSSTEKNSLDYYLENNQSYNKNIATPESILNFQVGEWHVRPEQIERYFYKLAEQSDRVVIKKYASSYEQRPLFLAIISSPKNIKNLENIRKNHLQMKKDINRPAVTWMGYSVHGNEASGSNASMLLGYHLASANDDKTLKQLDDQIIIIDPMLNPDGLARFAHWVNMYKSKNPNGDPNTREHNEEWPQGRTNHYWFDLNRDWLLLQHPESQGRVKMFHHWKPNVVTDFHEMGTNNTYFFQPGVPSRQNPLTPKSNFELTDKIATYHAKALDKIGSLYYSKENFDDFYYGKGSTYPDINGAIGILFEQASSRGHQQKSKNGLITFPFAIKNHLTTSLSTLEAVQENRKTLLNYQREFYKQSKLTAKTQKIRAYIYSSKDNYRLKEFNNILNGHKIKTYPLQKDIEIDGIEYLSKYSFIVPLRQTQSALITAMFEQRRQFKDNTFYDVSSWTIPLAFDFKYTKVMRSDFDLDLYSNLAQDQTINFEEPESDAVAIAVPWKNFSTAKLLSFLLQKDLNVRTVTMSSVFKGKNQSIALSHGDLLIPLDSQPVKRKELFSLLAEKLIKLKMQPQLIYSGYAKLGNDLGSPSIPKLKKINPVLAIGEGVNQYQAGEVWHLLDQRLEQPLSMMSFKKLVNQHLNEYTHLILVDGSYSKDEKLIKKLSQWLNNGGVLISQSRATKWIADLSWLSSQEAKLDINADTKLPYAKRDEESSKHYIGGAITQLNMDTSHPLSFGLDDSKLPIFKRRQFALTEPKESFVSVGRFVKKPLMAGYMSKANQDNLSGKTSILVQGVGKGKIIAFTEDMNFRGYWLGTSRVFTNALYFSDLIDAPQKAEDKNN